MKPVGERIRFLCAKASCGRGSETVSVSERSFKVRQTDSLALKRATVAARLLREWGALTCSNGVHAVALVTRATALKRAGRGSVGGSRHGCEFHLQRLNPLRER